MKQRPIHPSEVLVEDFMKPRSMSDEQLAEACGIMPKYIKQVTLYREPITSFFASFLGPALGTSDKFWTRLQAEYDAAIATYNKENAT